MMSLEFSMISVNQEFELNGLLRQRDAPSRQELLTTWGVFMHFAMSGIQKLPDFEGECWRGDRNVC